MPQAENKEIDSPVFMSLEAIASVTNLENSALELPDAAFPQDESEHPEASDPAHSEIEDTKINSPLSKSIQAMALATDLEISVLEISDNYSPEHQLEMAEYAEDSELIAVEIEVEETEVVPRSPIFPMSLGSMTLGNLGIQTVELPLAYDPESPAFQVADDEMDRHSLMSGAENSPSKKLMNGVPEETTAHSWTPNLETLCQTSVTRPHQVEEIELAPSPILSPPLAYKLNTPPVLENHAAPAFVPATPTRGQSRYVGVGDQNRELIMDEENEILSAHPASPEPNTTAAPASPKTPSPNSFPSQPAESPEVPTQLPKSPHILTTPQSNNTPISI